MKRLIIGSHLLAIDTLPSLLESRLSRCQLWSIPHLSIVNFTSLSFLDVWYSMFYSSIPFGFSVQVISSILMSVESRITGPFPNGSSSITSRKFLTISYNYLNSSLLPLFCSVKNLVSLDLNASTLEGPILCGFRNMTRLSYLDLSICRFGSTIPSCFYDAILIQITCKVLSQVP